MSQQQASDKGQKALCELSLGLSATLLVAAVPMMIYGVDAPALPATLVTGVVTAVLALLFNSAAQKQSWLTLAGAVLLILHSAILILVIIGVIPSGREEPGLPPATPTMISPSASPSTSIPSATIEPTATPTLEQQQPPSPTPTVAELATPTPTAVRVTPRAQTPTSPTATPTPRLYPAPQMLFPNDGHSFSSQELPTLKWEAIPNLAPGDRYLLHLEHGGGVHWEVIEAPQWTAADFGFRGLQPANGRYIWWVAVCRNAAVGASGTQPCELASPTSEPRGFAWLTPSDPTPMSPPPADPTPTSTPPVIIPDS